MTAARRTSEIAAGILPVALVIALWHGIALSGIAPAVLLPAPGAVFARLIAVFGCGGGNGKVAFSLRNALADQLLDRGHRLRVERRDDRDRRAGTARASGASDAVDVIIGMVRDIEIVDVAYRGNIEAAGRDVGSDQHWNLTLAELL